MFANSAVNNRKHVQNLEIIVSEKMDELTSTIDRNSEQINTLEAKITDMKEIMNSVI